MLAHLLGGFDDLGELDIRRRIEIEHQPSRYVVFMRRAIPGMQLEPAELRHRGEPLDTVDLRDRACGRRTP